MFYSSAETERSIKQVAFFNGFELCLLEVSRIAILVPKVCSTNLHTWGVMGSFEDEICTFPYAPQLY